MFDDPNTIQFILTIIGLVVTLIGLVASFTYAWFKLNNKLDKVIEMEKDKKKQMDRIEKHGDMHQMKDEYYEKIIEDIKRIGISTTSAINRLDNTLVRVEAALNLLAKGH